MLLRPGQLVTLHLEDEEPSVGSGFRTFLVLRVGHKLAHLYHWPTLTKIEYPIDRLAVRKLVNVVTPEKWTRSSIAAWIERTATIYRESEHKHRFSENTVVEALALLKGEKHVQNDHEDRSAA